MIRRRFGGNPPEWEVTGTGKFAGEPQKLRFRSCSLTC